jgi:hypothetical protein
MTLNFYDSRESFVEWNGMMSIKKSPLDSSINKIQIAILEEGNHQGRKLSFFSGG